MEFVDGKADRKKADRLAELIAEARVAPTPAEDGTESQHDPDSSSGRGTRRLRHRRGVPGRGVDGQGRGVLQEGGRRQAERRRWIRTCRFRPASTCRTTKTCRGRRRALQVPARLRRLPDRPEAVEGGGGACIARRGTRPRPTRCRCSCMATPEAGRGREARAAGSWAWPTGSRSATRSLRTEVQRGPVQARVRRRLAARRWSWSWRRAGSGRTTSGTSTCGWPGSRPGRRTTRRPRGTTRRTWSACSGPGRTFVDAKAYLTVPELARTYRARALLAAGKVDEALAEARAGLAVIAGQHRAGDRPRPGPGPRRARRRRRTRSTAR